MGRRRSTARKRPVTATAPLGANVERVASSVLVHQTGAEAGKSKRTHDPIATAHAAAARGGKGQRAKAHAALIAAFHALNKRLAAARVKGDEKTVRALEDEIEALGGIERYQEASVRGEKLKGGTTNTAQWLVKKLTELGYKPVAPRRLILLDVGALSVNYAKVPWIDADAIDLNARVPGVSQIDFFDFVPPQHRVASAAADGDRSHGGPYDVVSLSLVVNFVPDAGKRGAMLQRSCALLKPGGILFVVLPRACVENSRYVTDESLRAVFTALGLDVEHQHFSLKLAFYVLRLSLEHPHRFKNPNREVFKRRLLRPGEARNNFVITLTDGTHG